MKKDTLGDIEKHIARGILAGILLWLLYIGVIGFAIFAAIRWAFPWIVHIIRAGV